jgi:hypothetical protein
VEPPVLVEPPDPDVTLPEPPLSPPGGGVPAPDEHAATEQSAKPRAAALSPNLIT